MSKAMDSNTANDAAEARHPAIGRERLERRLGEIDERVWELRKIERREYRASDERKATWNQEWRELLEERRATARQIAELSPLSVGDALTTAIEALRRESAEALSMSNHAGGDPDYCRRSIALETTARVLDNVDPLAFQRLATEALDRAETT